MRSPWFGRDLLIFLIFLCPLFTSSPTLDEECTVSRTRERTTTFDGAIQLLTEELTGTRVVIQIDRIINDPSGLLQFAKGRIVASLPSSKCISQVRTGVSATWVGGHQWMNNKLIYVVRRLQQGESSYSQAEDVADPCSMKVCHPGAVCEAWNDLIRTRVAVCTCLSLRQLMLRERCEQNRGEVCASNGRLYASPCNMLHAACLQQIHLNVVSWTAVNERDCQQQAANAERRFQQRVKISDRLISQSLPQHPSELKKSSLDSHIMEEPQQDAAFRSSQDIQVSKQSTPTDGKAHDCPLDCSQSIVQPVCGTGGRTYLNACLLRQRACMGKVRQEGVMSIRMQHWGYCPSAPPEIETVFCDQANYCRYGARCSIRNTTDNYRGDAAAGPAVMSHHQGRGGSVCSCDHIRCQKFSSYQPLCGDDGVTYENECFLKKSACVEQSPKTKLHNGPCKVFDRAICDCSMGTCFRLRFATGSAAGSENPCKDYRCPYNAWCIPSDNLRSPRCVCYRECFDVGDYDGNVPVCGSNGVTYKSLCHLKREACTLTADIEVKYWGKCDPCDIVNCSPGSVCKLDEERRPICQCGGDLYEDGGSCHSSAANPVCANDGRTYPNVCVMRETACLKDQHLRVLFDQNCVAGFNPCLGQGCTWPGEKCRVDIQGRKTCVCSELCPAIVVPVCGSDGLTYDSVCHLQRTACLKKRHIWVVYAGQCVDSNNICERRGLHCRGFEICTRETSQSSRDDALNYVSPTLKCSCPFCPEGGLGGKVCGTDDRTYPSECSLRSAACQTGRLHLKVKQRGACDACKNQNCSFYSMCQTDEAGEAFCACPTNCLMVNKPVCGSDGRTYNNECLLKVHACAVQRAIRVVDSKMCESCAKPCPLGMRCLGGECVCRDSCPKPGLPGEVCGTDGRLYPSVCELRRQACVNKMTIKVDASGMGCRRNTPVAPPIEGKQDFQADGVTDNDCGCNKIGSRDNFCDYKGRCRCHWGVEGVKCDQCAAGYWGISNGKSCVSCSCNRFGAINPSKCDSHSGECKCKPGIQGQQCNICPNGEPVTANGCSEPTHKGSGVEPLSKPTLYATTDKRIMGAHFTFMASASVPFEWPILAPFTLTLNFTPSTSAANGNLALLSVRDNSGTNQYKFLKLALVSGRVELNYVGDLTSGKVKRLESREIVEPRPYSLAATVTANEGLLLRVVNNDGTSFVEKSSIRLLRSDEYSDFLNHRKGSLVIGCLETKVSRNYNCGFSGCLTGATVSYMRGDGQSDIQILFTATRGRIPTTSQLLRWIKPAEDGTNECVAEGVSSNPSEQQVEKKEEEPPSVRTQTQKPQMTPRDCGKSNPCKNGAICKSFLDGSFASCVCLPGWQGKFCDNEATVVPEFNGEAFIRLAGPSGPEALRKRRMKMEITFLRKSDEGVIFAIPPAQNGSEFVAIRAEADGCVKVYLRVGRITKFYEWVLRYFNDGNRIAIAKVCSVSNDQWHTLTIDKKNIRLRVFLDDKLGADIRLLPPFLPKNHRSLKQALTTFDLSSSPVYLGGLPVAESRFVEHAIQTKRFFVGAIQKVVINGAELVLAGPTKASVIGLRPEVQEEHWEGTVQWQGPPCGDKYSTCGEDPNSLEQICRPMGARYKCSCASPLTHMSFVNKLTTAKSAVDLLNDVAAQSAVSIEAERMACEAVASARGLQSKDLQADVPNKDEDPVKTFSRVESKPQNSQINTQYDGVTGFHMPVQFFGTTILKYEHLLPNPSVVDNLRIKLKTTAPDGLVMLIPDKEDTPDEFIALALSSGRPEIYLSLKESPTPGQPDRRKVLNLKSAFYLADGNWHDILLLRNKGQIFLLIDNQMISRELVGTDGILNTRGDIWLGGSLTPISELPWQYQRNFTGCVAAFFSNENVIELISRADVLYGPISACL